MSPFYRIAVGMGLLLTLMRPTLKASPDTGISLPDSVLTEDHVYEYTFSDPGKAQRIAEKMRMLKSLPEFRLDITEGDFYFNTGRYHQALKYYFRALKSDSVQNDDTRYMEQVHRLISCYDCLHNESKKAVYVELLLNKARACNNIEMQSAALFNMGKMIYYQGNKEQGYKYIRQAISLMGKTDYKNKFDNLRYNYNTLLVFQECDKQYAEALQTLDALEQVLMTATGKETYMEGLDDKEKKALYAHRAIILSRLGRQAEARSYYRQFLSKANVYDHDNYLIMPYLFDQRMYDDIIRMNSSRERFLREQGDTVNYHMTTIMRSLGKAYECKGDYKTATRYFKSLALLRDSIKNREQRSAALELETVYETNEKDLLLQKQASDMQRRTILLFVTAGGLLLSGVLLWKSIRYNRVIRRKNKLMISTVNDLLSYKEENQSLRGQIESVKQRLNQTPLPETDNNRGTTEEDNAYSSLSANEEKADDNAADKALFERLRSTIIDRKLYLDTDFSRETLIKTVHIPKNKFAQLFRQYAGITFPKYVNTLRLEHAAEMLKEYPDYTIDIIAKESGISTAQTFHRLFLEKFGVTPAEFRNGIKKINKDAEKANILSKQLSGIYSRRDE